MKHFYLKVGLFGLLLMFCILFGVSLASSGVESIQGPLPPSSKPSPAASAKPQSNSAVSVAQAGKPVSDVKATAPSEKPKAGDEAAAEPIADHDDSLNHVGNKLGDLLQIVAHHGIKLFVSLFDAVLGKG
ncbi:hypothetical protein [Paenibacillus aestuarii]|uniref:DUF3679 domain-containing protein n=1 Tax=Paenibacillus aestuarii TaxID=516965 RepID=A0ABW0KB54_9BACL|nr:hypothetical protein [Paenibacillus aestuarii]